MAENRNHEIQPHPYLIANYICRYGYSMGGAVKSNVLARPIDLEADL